MILLDYSQSICWLGAYRYHRLSGLHLAKATGFFIV